MPPFARPETVCCANSELWSEPTTSSTQMITRPSGTIHDVVGRMRSVPEVAASDGVVRRELLARARERDLAHLEDVRAQGERERRECVLLDEEDGRALARVELAEDAEDLADDDGREPERRLVEEQEPRALHD